jgi:signal transduction histidine kinase
MALILWRESLPSERAVLSARRHARYIAELLGCDQSERLRIPALVFAVAHDVFRHTFAGNLEFAVILKPEPLLSIEFSGRGEGTPTWQRQFVSESGHSDNRPHNGAPSGANIGDLLRDFTIETSTNHVATVRFTKKLSTLPTSEQLQQIVATLAEAPNIDDFAEVSLQNDELIGQQLELQRRQTQLQDLGRELEETNRGVVALYAEVEDQAAKLRQADAMKSRFLSNMSHEFRTPLGSIRALAQLLLDRIDGELSAEQDQQVRLILDSASELSELVNDLLDLAKIEAGKVEVYQAEFSLVQTFGTLRGMLGPLFTGKDVQLIFEIEAGIDILHTDEAKVSQILRNFISNALKFTKQGRVTVSATREFAAGGVRLAVADTGIGIASHDLDVIFEEFTQIENRLQQFAKGTGLGLPLCRQLANLLAARIEVCSAIGEGSTFSLVLPTNTATVETTSD